jgi:hypothetical protein
VAAGAKVGHGLEGEGIEELDVINAGGGLGFDELLQFSF